jgi:drug/metabolite transporter (DMT)-like permease
LTKYTRAVLELILAGILWGASFTLVNWALKDFSTSTLIFWRFLLAFIIGEAILFFFFREDFKKSRSDIQLSSLAGFFLALSLILQTQGQIYTTATNSGFITSLYVIIVPIIGGIFYRHKIRPAHFLLSLTAFAGMGLLLNIHDFSAYKFNQGDLLTLACAVAAAFHIITVGIRAPKTQSAFRFNTYQNFWTLLMVLPFLGYEISQKNISMWPNPSFKSVASLVSLSVLVSVLAFFLQVRSQKVLSTTTSSLLCLLEAPNAFLFALFFLNESLNPTQIAGMILILSSSAFSIYIDRPDNGHN